MQLKERFCGQDLVISTFDILFQNRLSRAINEDISKASNNAMSLYPKDFTGDLESELPAFANEFCVEIKEKWTAADL